MSAWIRCLTLGSARHSSAVVMASPASAQTKLRWAHVYEITEPYHTEALWAAGEIRKRSNGKFDSRCFQLPGSATRTSSEGTGIGTVDIVYVGINFLADQPTSRWRITGAPFHAARFRALEGLSRQQALSPDLWKDYESREWHKIVALTYYGQRHVTANKPISKPEDMKGMRLRVPPAPLVLMFTRSVGANATPIAFSDVYIALQQRWSTVRRIRCRPSWRRNSTRCRATSC